MSKSQPHWYELNPSRLEMEKMAMAQHFPDFVLMTVEDGTLRWSGFIMSESKQKYNVVVEYLNIDNGDVKPIVIPVLPDVNGLFCGGMVKFREIMTHAMCGSIGLLNLHSDDRDKSKLETAASTLKKAQVWFENYESEKRKVEEEETMSRDAAARERQKLRDKLINSIKNGGKVQFDRKESVSNKICVGREVSIAEHNLSNNTSTNSEEISIPPSHIDEWYDKYPGLYKIRLSYLHQIFPHFECKIEKGSLTGLCTGNIIFLSGAISFGTKNNNGEIISYNIEIRVRGYQSRTDISTSDDNLAYISSIMGYTPTPFGSCWFKEHSSSISTLLDTVMNAYEWLSQLDCGLRGDLHSCFFQISRMNVPEQSESYDIESKVLNEDTYLYQTPASRKRRWILSERYPHRIVKLK